MCVKCWGFLMERNNQSLCSFHSGSQTSKLTMADRGGGGRCRREQHTGEGIVPSTPLGVAETTEIHSRSQEATSPRSRCCKLASCEASLLALQVAVPLLPHCTLFPCA